MKFQADFSHAAFGGFKKEEVLAHLSRLEEEYNREVGELQSQIGAGSTQITELKSIIEQQYQKIVEAAKENEGLRASLSSAQEKLAVRGQEIEALRNRLAPYEEADDYAERLRRQADALLEKAGDQAKASAAAAEERSSAAVSQAQDQAKAMLMQAQERARAIVSPAREQAEKLLSDAEEEARKTSEKAEQIFAAAKEQAQSILEGARQKEQELLEKTCKRVEQNVALSEENEKRSEQVLADAEREAERIIRNARFAAREEKEHYENCVKSLELQKTVILETLDQIKEKIASVEVTRPPKTDAQIAKERRLSTTEAIKRKFTLLNNRELKPPESKS